MKKIFSIVALALFFVANAHAGFVTPFKNLYTVINAVPSSVGEVYLEPAEDADNAYIYDMSEDFGSSAFLKITLGENGTEPEDHSVNTSAGVFMVRASAECKEGYELVCYANKIKDDNVYGPADCFAVFNQVSSDEARTTSFKVTGYDFLNINNVNHEQDGSSAEGDISREECFTSGAWSETPDQTVYAIFRKKGDEFPKFDESLIPIEPEKDESTDISKLDNAIYIERTAATPGQAANLVVKLKNAGAVSGVEFTVELPQEVATLGTPTLNTERTSETRTDFFDSVAGEGNVKVVAFSHNNYEFSGNDGAIATIPVEVVTADLARYEMRVTNVILALKDGTAVKCEDIMQYFVVADPAGINEITAPSQNDKIFRVDGVEVKKADKPGLYIQNGKTILVK